MPYRCVNQLYEDTDGWHPILAADLADMPRWQRVLLQLVMATPLKFVASIGQWFRSLDGFDLKLYPVEARGWVWLSWALPLGFIGVSHPPVRAECAIVAHLRAVCTLSLVPVSAGCPLSNRYRHGGGGELSSC